MQLVLSSGRDQRRSNQRSKNGYVNTPRIHANRLYEVDTSLLVMKRAGSGVCHWTPVVGRRRLDGRR